MARPKKNVEPILGIGKEPETKLTVQKSIPLFSLWRSDMTLSEFKILDTYLSRINSREPEKRTVVFTKGELEGLLGVKRINKTDLTSRLKGLGRFVELDKTNSKKVHQIALFEEAYGEMDDNGQWVVKLPCTPAAMKYIFNVEKLGYLRYKLRCIVNLTSRYTYILFTYLEHNRFRKSWEVTLDELKEVLNCEDDELYQEFKFFNQRILKRCQKELLEKTECRFTYEPVKTGRKVTSIKFTLETLADAIEPAAEPDIPGQLSIDDYEDPNAIYAEVLPSSLTPDQVEALRTLAVKKVYWDPDGALPRECVIANYLREKVVLMNAHNRNVKHPFNYLQAMIEKDESVYA